MQLPGGTLDAVVRAEVERSSLERSFEADRAARSVFAELRAPLVAGTNERGAKREVLSLLGAARNDHYSDFVSKTTLQAGIELRPSEPVLLRATHGTAFKPPTLFNLAAPVMSFPS